MPIVTKPNTFVAVELIDANQMNQNFDTIYSLVNGNLDGANLAPLALNDTTKFASEVVTQSKTKGVIYTQDLYSQSWVVAGGLASYSGSPANQIQVNTVTANVIQSDGSYRHVLIAGTTYTTSALNTTYYLDLQPDGTMSWNTAHSGQTGYLPLARVTTDGVGNVLVVTDVRMLSAGIAWINLSKVSSSLADLAVRSATDLTSGTLNVLRLPTAIPAPNIGNGDVDNTKLSYLNSVTSNVQTQVDAKIPLTQRAAANGVATLDTGAKVPLAQVPTAIPAINIGTGAVDNTHLNYLQNVTSDIQNQLNGIVSGAVPDGSLTDAKLSNTSTEIKTRFVTQVPKVFNVYGYGAVGSGDETSAIQNTINAAIAANSKSVFFPSGVYSATSLTGLSSVNLLGDNATLTVGGVDTKITQFGIGTKATALYDRAISEQIAPMDSLKNIVNVIKNNATARIAFIGDSITENGGLGNTDDSYASRFITQLAKQLPNVSITSQNFALGGRWLALFNDPNYKGISVETGNVADGFTRSWSTVGKSWQDSVKDFNPDLVILAFGMNDALSNITTIDALFASQLGTAMGIINGWASTPSTVLVTTILPTTNTALYSQRQDVTNAVVRATRAFAKANKLAVADASRLFQILRDGTDDVTRGSSADRNWVNYPVGWSGSTSGYSLASSTLTPSTGGMIQRDRTFYNGVITVSVTPAANGLVTEIHYRSSDLGDYTVYVGSGAAGAGYVRLYTYEVSSGYTLLQQTTGLTIPAGSATVIQIIAENDNHQVFVAGVQQINQSSYTNMQDGKVLMGSTVSPYSTLSNLNIQYKDVASATPLFTEKDLLGLHVSPYDEGNGINHPSPLGHALFYLSAFNGIIRELSHVSLIPFAGMASQALINANMDIAQAGTSFTNTGSNTYTLDMWLMLTALDGGTLPTTIVHSQQNLGAGELPNSDHSYRINVNGAGSAFGVNAFYSINQRIEYGTRKLCGAGKKVTVSFYAKSDIAGKRIAVGLKQAYGSGGSPSATEHITPTSTTVRTLSTGMTKYTFTFATNTLSGKTFGTTDADYLELGIYVMWGTTTATARLGGGTAETFVGAGNVDITQAVVNAGDTAVAFQPVHPITDMNNCQSFYEKSFNYADAPADNIVAARLSWRGLGGLFDCVTIPFKVVKRRVPSVSFYNPKASVANKIRNDSTGTDLAAAGDISQYCLIIYPNGVSTTSGNVLITHFTADSRIYY